MTMPEQRGKHFREDMAEIIARRVESPHALITVVDAALTEDQKYATITLSILPVNAKSMVLEALKTFRHDMIKDMAKTLKLRHIPNLNWKFDDTEEEAFRIETVMEELKEKGEL